MLPKKEYMITTRSDRQTDRLLFKKRSRSRPGAEARRQGVILKGENALAAGLYHAEGWSNLQQVLRNGNYQGLTLLRLNDIVENPLAVATLQQLQPGF